MTKADQAVDAAADRVATFVRDARSAGGIRGKVGNALADDPEFIRKLKPSLIKARAKGARAIEPAGGERHAPSGPQVERPRAKRRGGPSPWLVVGAAFAAGYLLAKTIDWRGHSHPRL
ncbi:MAG TPA: hypothetical protein VFU51_01375 [Gaiellaceae bacterium]|jgi:hypothetical protein|nr:hypothetical protein [Gaiellaceae bacterium]